MTLQHALLAQCAQNALCNDASDFELPVAGAPAMIISVCTGLTALVILLHHLIVIAYANHWMCPAIL
jgi:hypothetical protein